MILSNIEFQPAIVEAVLRTPFRNNSQFQNQSRPGGNV